MSVFHARGNCIKEFFFIKNIKSQVHYKPQDLSFITSCPTNDPSGEYVIGNREWSLFFTSPSLWNPCSVSSSLWSSRVVSEKTVLWRCTPTSIMSQGFQWNAPCVLLPPCGHIFYEHINQMKPPNTYQFCRKNKYKS